MQTSRWAAMNNSQTMRQRSPEVLQLCQQWTDWNSEGVITVSVTDRHTDIHLGTHRDIHTRPPTV